MLSEDFTKERKARIHDYSILRFYIVIEPKSDNVVISRVPETDQSK